MVKHLQFSKIQMVERTGALMLVWFLDTEGNMYDWAPKWKDAEQVFLKGIAVERFNKPESEFLNRFAATAQQVVDGAQRIKSATKVRGTFESYEDEFLVIGSRPQALVKPGFEVSVDFLDAWMGTYIEVLLVNDIAVRIKELDTQFSGPPTVVREYPPAPDEPLVP